MEELPKGRLQAFCERSVEFSQHHLSRKLLYKFSGLRHKNHMENEVIVIRIYRLSCRLLILVFFCLPFGYMDWLRYPNPGEHFRCYLDKVDVRNRTLLGL